MDKRRAFELLRAKGATEARVEFSGGNDEGGVDGITLLVKTAEGPTLEVDLPPYYGGGYTYVNGRYVENETTTPDEELARLLYGPIDDAYSSFAGEFNVYGTVTWNVQDESVVMKKSESVQTYESSEDWL